MLQTKGLLSQHSKEEIATIWREICDRCPPVEESVIYGERKIEEEKFRFDETLQNNTHLSYDVCIAFAPNGSSVAQYVIPLLLYNSMLYRRSNSADACRTIMEGLKKGGLQCVPFRDELMNLATAEQRISHSFITLVLLTESCLENREILFALKAASFHYQPHTSRVILVPNTSFFIVFRFTLLNHASFLFLQNQSLLASKRKQSLG